VDHRTIEELVDLEEPGMELIREWITEATNSVTVLDCDHESGRRSLLALQVTSRSPMGALALETGGLLVDGGWVRVYGSGHSRLARAIDSWNRLGAGEEPRAQGVLFVGDDAVGGFFAINGGGIEGELGHVFYFGPDSLAWTEVADSYSAWLCSLFTGDLDAFYQGERWAGWRDDVGRLAGDRGFSVYPPLWASGPAIGERSRRAVPVDELWNLHFVEYPKQIGHGSPSS
jgi:hypothetical protein